jgi:replicative DNA helicase
VQESIILTYLVLSEEYNRKVFPYLKKEYFRDPSSLALFEIFTEYTQKYKDIPTKEALGIELARKTGLSQYAFDDSVKLLQNMAVEEKANIGFLVDKTEEFCKDRAIYNAYRSGLAALDDKSGKVSTDVIKDLQSAFAVNFDSSLGHSYTEDWKARFEEYQKPEIKIPFKLRSFNDITNGGISRKTLNAIMAPTGVGKSAILCSFAADYLMMGYNLVYFSLEMPEIGSPSISERIDANLLDTNINELKDLPFDKYGPKCESLFSKTKGRFYVKEYPMTQAGVPHFRHFIHELHLKKNFVPDIIFVDYMGICTSSRSSREHNLYADGRQVAAELKGFGMETNTAVWTANQTNRTGLRDSDFEMDAVADSFGGPHAMDLFLALIASEELTAMNQIMVKQMGKNRYGDANKNRRFVVGVDRNKMRFYDIEQRAQDNLYKDEDGVSLFDKTSFGLEDKFLNQGSGFSGFK